MHIIKNIKHKFITNQEIKELMEIVKGTKAEELVRKLHFSYNLYKINYRDLKEKEEEYKGAEKQILEKSEINNKLKEKIAKLSLEVSRLAKVEGENIKLKSKLLKGGTKECYILNI